MNCVRVFSVACVLLLSTPERIALVFDRLVPDDDQPAKYCLCVPFWQCREDFSGLDDDGLAADVRRARSAKKSTSRCTGDLDVCCRAECGKKGSSELPEKRILGEAASTEFAEFPWMLGILDGRLYKCGASLIHPLVALTAAHCVANPGDYTVRAGEWHWERRIEPLPHQDRTVHQVIVHPDYHPPSLRSDVALVVLAHPFELTRNVGLVCLPVAKRPLDRTACVVTGWGRNSFRKGTYQPVLKKMTLSIVPRKECERALQTARLGPLFVLHDSFLCAGGPLYKDTCKGDGGGPLVCPVIGEERYHQIGIVSWGLTCGASHAPGVYANVELVSDWIDVTFAKLKLDNDAYKY